MVRVNAMRNKKAKDDFFYVIAFTPSDKYSVPSYHLLRKLIQSEPAHDKTYKMTHATGISLQIDHVRS